jgi:hypothetical protein
MRNKITRTDSMDINKYLKYFANNGEDELNRSASKLFSNSSDSLVAGDSQGIPSLNSGGLINLSTVKTSSTHPTKNQSAKPFYARVQGERKAGPVLDTNGQPVTSLRKAVRIASSFYGSDSFYEVFNGEEGWRNFEAEE